jgi:molybdopterin converting factor small subunit
VKPIVFVIPGQLRELAGNREEVSVTGRVECLRDALALLWRECPAVRDRVLTEQGDVRPHVNIFVDGDNSRQSGGLEMRVSQGAEIMILPAVSGGQRDEEPGTKSEE